MPLEPSPKRADYKTRKEYRFAHKKVKRNNMRQPVVIATAVVTVVAYMVTKDGTVGAIALVATPIAWVAFVRPWWNRIQLETSSQQVVTAGARYNVACPKCNAALTAPAGNGIKCPKCGFNMKVTPPVEPTVGGVGSAVTSTPVGSTSAEIERLAGLHAQGVLSDAEFAVAKSKVLG